jgi:hypothetical protein
MGLKRLKDLYDAGRLTRQELCAHIIELLPGVDVREVRQLFGSDSRLIVELTDWLRAIAGGATIFGGERDATSPSMVVRGGAARMRLQLVRGVAPVHRKSIAYPPLQNERMNFMEVDVDLLGHKFKSGDDLR